MINLASVTALNAFFSLNIGCLLGSYAIAIGCILYQRMRGEVLPDSQWSFSRLGLIINLLALCSVVPIFVFVMFPIGLPVKPDNMNWGSLMFGAVVVLSTTSYLLHGKFNYTSPRQRQRANEGVSPA
jgi:choline transport protein